MLTVPKAISNPVLRLGDRTYIYTNFFIYPAALLSPFASQFPFLTRTEHTQCLAQLTVINTTGFDAESENKSSSYLIAQSISGTNAAREPSKPSKRESASLSSRAPITKLPLPRSTFETSNTTAGRCHRSRFSASMSFVRSVRALL